MKAALRKHFLQYPFRVVAVVLSVFIAIEMAMIMSIPDYSEELEEARSAYRMAVEQNKHLHEILSVYEGS